MECLEQHTQEPEAVEALAAYLNRPVLDGILDLGAVKLVKSNRGDVFYVTIRDRLQLSECHISRRSMQASTPPI